MRQKKPVREPPGKAINVPGLDAVESICRPDFHLSRPDRNVLFFFFFVFVSVSIDSSSSAVGMWETRRVSHIPTAVSFMLVVFFSRLPEARSARDGRVRACISFSVSRAGAPRVPCSKAVRRAVQSV